LAVKSVSPVLALCAGLTTVLPAAAQPQSGSAELPVRRVTLFSSGVGYFEREGQVSGNARIDLQFPAADINDLLKSLILQDAGGGQVSAITYDNRNPIEITLKSFSLDLTANPSMGDLLNQARGEKIEIVTAPDPKGLVGRETLAGVIVGVEKRQRPHDKDQVVEVSQLNLLTDEGLRGVPLEQVQRARFLKPGLDQEFRKALEVLAAGHDKQKKTVSLNFTGTGSRRVRLGYVTENPIWKTSYRLALDGTKVFLQGWALVENTTDEDWNDVRLTLVSGRPISFQMDLYEPLFVPRPVVEPELFASLRPPTYSGEMERANRKQEGQGRVPAGAPMTPGAALGRKAASAPAPSAGGDARREALPELGAVKIAGTDKLNLRDGIAGAAVATEWGEHFQYTIEQPVRLARQKSALLPIVNQDVSGTKVSIYNEAVHAKFPLLGLRFQNTTSLHLSQGPVTVLEEGAYAGDARLPDLQPKETRLLSYAVDLGTEVEPQHKAQQTLQSVRVVKGILHATSQFRETKLYTVKNRSPQARTVLIEHPLRPQFKLVSPAQAAERSREVYRFEVNAAPDKTQTLEVVEEQPRVQTVALTNADDEAVRVYLRASVLSDRVKKALEEALALKAKVSATRQSVQKEEQALKVIEQNQARMRANMERLPQTSDVYKGYLKKFEEQEPEIERRQKEVARLQELAATQQRAYEEYVAGLTVE
jgi:hypothetical protein